MVIKNARKRRVFFISRSHVLESLTIRIVVNTQATSHDRCNAWATYAGLKPYECMLSIYVHTQQSVSDLPTWEKNCHPASSSWLVCCPPSTRSRSYCHSLSSTAEICNCQRDAWINRKGHEKISCRKCSLVFFSVEAYLPAPT